MDDPLCVDGDCLFPTMEKQTPPPKESPYLIFCAAFPQLALVTRIFWCPKPTFRGSGNRSSLDMYSFLHLNLSPNQFLGSPFVGSLPPLGYFCNGFERDHLVSQSIKKASQHC